MGTKGSEVTFSLDIKDGKPKARDVSLADGTQSSNSSWDNKDDRRWNNYDNRNNDRGKGDKGGKGKGGKGDGDRGKGKGKGKGDDKGKKGKGKGKDKGWKDEPPP